MRNAPTYGLAALLLVSGCAVSANPFGGGADDGESSDAETKAGAATGSAEGTSEGAPLPEQTPIAGERLRSPAGIWRSERAFAASAPSVRAANHHAFPILGTDCMSCHGGSGKAPRFAFGGTIALGEKWVVAPAGWRPGDPMNGPGRQERANGHGYGGYDDYGSYDSYDECYEDDYGYGDYGYEDYGDGDYGYEDYGYGDYDSYDDYAAYGYGSCRRRGWPEYRTKPAKGVEIRLVGDDGKIFETVTDADGNFWFKSGVEVAQPSFTGVRLGEFQISGESRGTACGSCHENGAADSPGRIWAWNGRTPTRSE